MLGGYNQTQTNCLSHGVYVFYTYNFYINPEWFSCGFALFRFSGGGADVLY